MARFKLDREIVGLSQVIEKIMHVRVKDTFQDDETIYCVVDPGMVGKALGKGGVNVKKVQARFNKKIKVIEYSDSVEEFISKVIMPLKVTEILSGDGVVELRDESRKIKGQLVGRDGKNLQTINRLVKRFFNVEVKVV